MYELQFEFSKSGGCDKALLVFKTVVKYYNNHGSTVFVSALDLTKAYDRLNQCIIILKLCDISVSRDIVMLVFWVQHLCAIVVWNSVSFSMFSVKIGVKQCGVCSSWLFNVYINELILKLEDIGLGSRLHDIFVWVEFFMRMIFRWF